MCKSADLFYFKILWCIAKCKESLQKPEQKLSVSEICGSQISGQSSYEIFLVFRYKQRKTQVAHSRKKHCLNSYLFIFLAKLSVIIAPKNTPTLHSDYYDTDPT